MITLCRKAEIWRAVHFKLKDTDYRSQTVSEQFSWRPGTRPIWCFPSCWMCSKFLSFSACKVNTNSQPASLLLIYEGLCAIFHSVWPVNLITEHRLCCSLCHMCTLLLLPLPRTAVVVKCVCTLSVSHRVLFFCLLRKAIKTSAGEHVAEN